MSPVFENCLSCGRARSSVWLDQARVSWNRFGTVGSESFGHFRCQDGLVVMLTEAEEGMIGTLTKQRVAAAV